MVRKCVHLILFLHLNVNFFICYTASSSDLPWKKPGKSSVTHRASKLFAQFSVNICAYRAVICLSSVLCNAVAHTVWEKNIISLFSLNITVSCFLTLIMLSYECFQFTTVYFLFFYFFIRLILTICLLLGYWHVICSYIHAYIHSVSILLGRPVQLVNANI